MCHSQKHIPRAEPSEMCLVIYMYMYYVSYYSDGWFKVHVFITIVCIS